jgi:hypothetical protein
MRAHFRRWPALLLAPALAAACGSATQSGTVRVKDSVPGAHAGATTAPGAGADKFEGDRPTLIDHEGEYVWMSSAVFPSAPLSMSAIPRITGDAEIANDRPTLVEVPGGVTIQVNFDVVRFSGSPSVTWELTAKEQAASTGGAG